MSATRRPNVLVFMADHQRADTVLSTHSVIKPNVGRLAREGVTFTNAFCPAPHCCPSRATFFTGLYPSRHGVWNNVCNAQALSRGLRPGVRLWSEDLAAAGYDLRFCGKWHVSAEESPADRGWTEEFVSAAAGTIHGVDWDFYRRLAQENDVDRRREGEILRPGYGTYRLYDATEQRADSHDESVVARAVDVLHTLPHNDAPWGLFVGAIGPHDPYEVPQRYLDLYDVDLIDLPVSFGDELTDKPAVYGRMREQIFGQLTPREVREAIRHFWAYCTYLDDLFGQLMDALDRSGQADNTLVVYCSDHGDYCGEHGLFCKGIPCFQGAYRVPAIVRWPGRVSGPGRRVDDFISLADFAPTLIDAAGLRADRHFVGMSLIPLLEGRTPPHWRDEIHTQCNGVELYYTQRSVMTRDVKYVFNGFDRDELYDLRSDPDEMHNVAQLPEYEPVKREMCQRMWRFAWREADTAINPYITVGLAPYGPAVAFEANHGATADE
ncbi:MAG: sulfatase-like hydrolase/transferase [Chloroflexi bacterium]|nr:sulfatase-like hydrolase/transferase [Chloroflexota bacterium]